MPAKRPTQAIEQPAYMDFPFKGIDVSQAYSRQSQGTTPVGINVRAYEALTQRMRGGSRPGLKKYISTKPGGASVIQDLNSIVTVGISAPVGSFQTSTSGRGILLTVVNAGNLYVAVAGGTTWAAATGNPLLNTTGLVASSVVNQKLWLVDGTNFNVYTASTNTIAAVVASSGSLPIEGGNAPRLACTWRGRLVLSGISSDGQNWFMSAVNDPTNWNYFPSTPVVTQAVSGNDSPLGLIGDVVTCLIPYTDDVLLIGCSHTISQISGDPMAGGQIDLVSDSIGMAWGQPWCKGPEGVVYFASNKGSIYMMQPGQPQATGIASGLPQRISQQIDPLLTLINPDTHTIRLAWDDRFQGLHVFVSTTASASVDTHYFWEQRNGAWWQDQFATSNMNPLALVVFDGSLPGDRHTLIGSFDGFVRSIDPTTTTDDGTNIASSVMLGPLQTQDVDDMLLKEMTGILGVNSGTVSYSVFVGTTAEIALSNSAVRTGTFSVAGMNYNQPIRSRGHGVWVELTAMTPWALEHIRSIVATKGKISRRKPE